MAAISQTIFSDAFSWMKRWDELNSQKTPKVHIGGRVMECLFQLYILLWENGPCYGTVLYFVYCLLNDVYMYIYLLAHNQDPITVISSIANALELHLSCTNPSISWAIILILIWHCFIIIIIACLQEADTYLIWCFSLGNNSLKCVIVLHWFR